MVDFFKAEKVTDSLTAIRSLTGEIMYLYEGSSKALLIDTCLGIGSIRQFVESLTKKPLTVILTHGHIDHAMGAAEFESVYLNENDRELYDQMSATEGRLKYIEMNLGPDAIHPDPEDIITPYPVHFLDLVDGDSFDLGGKHADIFALPGHTKGSMVVLLREEGILITGDACNTSTFLFDQNTLSVEKYRNELIRIQKRLEGQYQKIFIMHHQMEVSANLLQNVIDVCDTVLTGKADDIPFNFMGQMNYIAKTVGENFIRLDGVEGNIIYNKKKIWG